MDNHNWWFSSPLAVGFGFFIVVIALWSLYWQARAMWKAARAGHMGWFIALLLIHTAGILDILYIYVFSKPKDQRDHKSSEVHHHHEHHHHTSPSDPTV